MRKISEAKLKKMETRKNKAYDSLSVLRELVEEIASSSDSYYSERSEKWQESEVGQDYEIWVSELQNLEQEIEDLCVSIEYIDFQDVLEP
jgi:antirestriction protein